MKGISGSKKPEVRAIKREIYKCRTFMKNAGKLLAQSRARLSTDDLSEIYHTYLEVSKYFQMEQFRQLINKRRSGNVQ